MRRGPHDAAHYANAAVSLSICIPLWTGSEFSLTDKSIQHRHTVNDSVPVWLLVVIAFVAPLAIQAIISLGIARSTWDFHVSFLGLVLSHALTATATTLIKVTVGRPRPDLLDRCQPLAGASDPSPWGLVTDAVCTNAVEGHLVTEGFRSFPSGHSSTSFAGLAFLSLYLAGKLYRYGAQAHAAVQWIVYVPIIGATLIAASRTADNRHHATDVVAGGILGSVVAISTYFTYYPSLLHRECHKPYPPRIPRSDGMDESSMLANEEASRASLNASSGDADRSGGPENARVDNTGYMTRLGLDIEAQDTMEGLSAWKASSPA